MALINLQQLEDDLKFNELEGDYWAAMYDRDKKLASLADKIHEARMIAGPARNCCQCVQIAWLRIHIMNSAKTA